MSDDMDTIPPLAGTSKRPASTDLTETADKKSKTVTGTSNVSKMAKAPRSDDPSRSSSSTVDFFSTLPMNTLDAHSIVTEPVFIVIEAEGFKHFFQALRTEIIANLYPDSNYMYAGLINAEEFTSVCNYLLKARIDAVYSNVSGRRTKSRIAVPRDYRVPKALADVLNGIG